MKPTLRFTALLGVAALALSIPVSSAFAAPPPDPNSIPNILQEIKHHAAVANREGELLVSYSNSRSPWRAYAQTLTSIKQTANELFKDYSRLQRVRDSGTPAQQEAIDRLEPLVRDMAATLNNTIVTLNAHQNQVNMPRFRDQVRDSSEKINAVYKHLCQCTGKNAKV